MSKSKLEAETREVWFLSGFVKVFVEGVVPALEKRLAPFLAAGERMPDLALLARLLVRLAEWRLERLESVERSRSRAEMVLRKPRRERDVADDRLRCHLRGARNLFGFFYERGGCVGLTLVDEPIPQQRDCMLRYAGVVAQELREISPEASVGCEPWKLAAAIEEAAGDLRRALGAVEGGEAEAGRCREARKRARAGFKVDCNVGVRVLTDLGVLGDKGELMKRVLATRKR